MNNAKIFSFFVENLFIYDTNFPNLWIIFTHFTAPFRNDELLSEEAARELDKPEEISLGSDRHDSMSWVMKLIENYDLRHNVESLFVSNTNIYANHIFSQLIIINFVS